MNGKKITNDMAEAFESLRAGDYKGYGMALGSTFRHATTKNTDLFLY
jgi:hypothetical protein